MLLLGILVPRERAARAQAAFERAQARAAAAERETMLARLKLLEAQVEPHFLYNTLANILRAIDADPSTAKRMVDRLIAMLRGSAKTTCVNESPLRDQLDHLRAYLDLMTLPGVARRRR